MFKYHLCHRNDMAKYEFTATIRPTGAGSMRVVIPAFWIKELGLQGGDSIRLAIIKRGEPT
jgi:hypothetical protein